ncbi:MAG: hypothetical protein ACHQQS_00075 [Thermoanaerobaculales bacterium]
MRPRRSAASVLLLTALVAGACRTLAPPAPLPANWRELAAAPAPFAALYRLSCCGQRNLVLIARGDAGHLSVSVAVPPGGQALAAWVDASGGWVSRGKEGCREALPEGVLPLSPKASVPLDPELAGRLLSGLLPENAAELPNSPGWVEGSGGGLWWRARVEGPTPRCTRVIVGRPGSETPVLNADLGDPRGQVPGKLLLRSGGVKAELALQEWRQSETPSPPGWLGQPVCPGRS